MFYIMHAVALRKRVMIIILLRAQWHGRRYVTMVCNIKIGYGRAYGVSYVIHRRTTYTRQLQSYYKIGSLLLLFFFFIIINIPIIFLTWSTLTVLAIGEPHAGVCSYFRSRATRVFVWHNKNKHRQIVNAI